MSLPQKYNLDYYLDQVHRFDHFHLCIQWDLCMIKTVILNKIMHNFNLETKDFQKYIVLNKLTVFSDIATNHPKTFDIITCNKSNLYLIV